MKELNYKSMTTTSTSISNTVMRRVRVIHAMRPLLSGSALASVLFLLAVWGIGREVWVAHVLQNFMEVERSGNILSFLVSAFVNTRFIVQVLTIIAGGAFVYALHETARTFSNQTTVSA
jgi:hypothetical protein